MKNGREKTKTNKKIYHLEKKKKKQLQSTKSPGEYI